MTKVVGEYQISFKDLVKKAGGEDKIVAVFYEHGIDDTHPWDDTRKELIKKCEKLEISYAIPPFPSRYSGSDPELQEVYKLSISSRKKMLFISKAAFNGIEDRNFNNSFCGGRILTKGKDKGLYVFSASSIELN